MVISILQVGGLSQFTKSLRVPEPQTERPRLKTQDCHVSFLRPSPGWNNTDPAPAVITSMSRLRQTMPNAMTVYGVVAVCLSSTSPLLGRVRISCFSISSSLNRTANICSQVPCLSNKQQATTSNISSNRQQATRTATSNKDQQVSLREEIFVIKYLGNMKQPNRSRCHVQICQTLLQTISSVAKDTIHHWMRWVQQIFLLKRSPVIVN